MHYVNFNLLPERTGAGARYSRKKHHVYIFYNTANANGKRYNSRFGTAFMTTPNLFYGNANLKNGVLKQVPNLNFPRQPGKKQVRKSVTKNLTPNQRANFKRRLIEIAGGNAGTARLLINNAINSRQVEINTPHLFKAGEMQVHKRELARYRAWKNILNNNVSVKPTKVPNFNVTRNTFPSHFKINQQLLQVLGTHVRSRKFNNRKARDVTAEHRRLKAIENARRAANARREANAKAAANARKTATGKTIPRPRNLST